MTPSSPPPAASRDLWHHYGRKRADSDHAVPDRLYWTWGQRSGPGCELLGELAGRTVADLGAGSARQAAHLVQHHRPARVDAIDGSPAQHAFAHRLYGHLRPVGLALVHADVLAHLDNHRETYDVAFSLFGAVCFTDPRPLLRAVHGALRPGGRLLFSTLGSYRDGAAAECDVRPADIPSRLPDGTRTLMRRWVLDAPVWETLLNEAGFAHIQTETLREAATDAVPAPETTVICAHR